MVTSHQRAIAMKDKWEILLAMLELANNKLSSHLIMISQAGMLTQCAPVFALLYFAFSNHLRIREGHQAQEMH